MPQIIPFRALLRQYRSHGFDMKVVAASGREQIREYLKAMSAGSRCGYSEPFMKEGIEFWRMHSNASHEFYEGVGSDGRMYKYSIGEGPIGDEGAWEKEETRVQEEFEKEFGKDIDLLAPGNEAIELEYFRRTEAVHSKYWGTVVSPITEMAE